MSPESRRGRHAGTCLPSIKKNEKTSGCSGASVAGWALAQGGTLAASPEEDRDVGGLSCRCRCPPPPRGGSSQDGMKDSRKKRSFTTSFRFNWDCRQGLSRLGTFELIVIGEWVGSLPQRYVQSVPYSYLYCFLCVNTLATITVRPMPIRDKFNGTSGKVWYW